MSRNIFAVAFTALFVSLAITGCDNDDTPTGPETPQPLNFEFTFQSSDEEFETGFADYPEGAEEQFDLAAGWADLPEHDSLDTGDKGIMLHGSNESDDLFMFVKRGHSSSDGVEADIIYQLDLTVTFATENGSGCSGAGGAPGESVYFKTGATGVEPVSSSVDGFMEMNIDKGQQSVSGDDAVVIGDLANGTSDCSGGLWVYKSLSLSEFYVRASENGDIWLMLGTDSAYEGITTYYITEIDVELTPTDLDSIPG